MAYQIGHLVDRVQARRKLDQRLDRIRSLADQPRPHRGWIRAIRDALGMSSTELARRLGISQSRIPDLERREVDGSIRMNTLKRVADALDCDVGYYLVPRTPLDEMVAAQARRKAESLVASVSQHSRLEDQEVSAESIAQQVDELTATWIDRRGLWAPTNTDA